MASAAPLRRMGAMALAGVVLLCLSPAAAQSWRGRAPAPLTYGEPADIIAADIAVARALREKGSPAGWRAGAAPDALIMPADRSVAAPLRADAFARGRPNRPASLHRNPQAVWMACDGSFAVAWGAWDDSEASGTSTGAASGAATGGGYVTVWQRQKKGGYKWVLDMADAGPAPQNASDMISASVADCPMRHHPRLSDAAEGEHQGDAAPVAKGPKDGTPDYLTGSANDHTLTWTGSVSLGVPRFTLMLKRDGAMREVLRIPSTPSTPTFPANHGG